MGTSWKRRFFFETPGTQLETGIMSVCLLQWYLWPRVNQPVAIWENVRNYISDMLCIECPEGCRATLQLRTSCLSQPRTKYRGSFLTFICPCIVNIIPNYNQQDATFLDLFVYTDALHVSGGSSAHHQEHITVHTASGIVNHYCC